MIYVIPDTHLGHENIKKYCNRPDGFEKIVEKNWNEIVSDSDTVIHLGDVAMKINIGDDYVKKLGKWNGRKILIKGNHDKNPDEFYINAGFVIVVNELAIRVNNIKILFTHRPQFNHDSDINIIWRSMMKLDFIFLCHLSIWVINRMRLMIILLTA